MPEVVVYLAAGRTAEQKKSLMTGITDAVVASLDVPVDIVTVQLVEAPRAEKMKGGLTFEERDAQP